MPKLDQVPVKDLTLDLANFRTVKQPSEPASVEAILATSPDRFWALTRSLLDSGYLPTENIIVLRGHSKATLIVKEGNRRIAALKLIHTLLSRSSFAIPDDVLEVMDAMSPEWLAANQSVPCSIYEANEAETVDLIVTLAHGKDQKAGRDEWNPVAKARHHRSKGGSEPALDLLELYLQHGKNITATQRAQWAGDYPLSVLDEAIGKLAPRLSLSSSAELISKYPKIPHRDAVETILYGIGQSTIGNRDVRDAELFGAKEGLPPLPTSTSGAGSGAGGAGKTAKSTAKASKKSTKTKGGKQRAYPANNPRSVSQQLRGLGPRGKGREKVATLLEEGAQLDLARTPLAFCFVLRSIFEISAVAYCKDHNIRRVKSDGKDKTLKELLTEVTSHLVAGRPDDRDFAKDLHGARTQLAQRDGLLSVTSMNALVHSAKFHAPTAAELSTLFSSVFPLVVALNS
jgi:hypothetical protein